jgi:hypothetical protein
MSMKFGMLAEYATPADLMHAAEKIRDAGFRRWDVFSPFPIHGMNQAMGLKNSKVGWFGFIGGVTGYTTGMIMIWWMNAHDYPIVVGGKPMFSPYYAFPPSPAREKTSFLLLKEFRANQSRSTFHWMCS